MKSYLCDKTTGGMKKVAWIGAIHFALFLSFAGNAHADTLGQEQIFFVNQKYDVLGRTSMSATLRLISDHAYWYVENDAVPPGGSQLLKFNDGLKALADTFETAFYPIETQFWGSEPDPGIDGDQRITVLLERLRSGNGGYFETANEFPRDAVARSNEREMVILDAASLNSQQMKMFLAHEFQHLISFDQKENLRGSSETTWLNEARSEYSLTRIGMNVPYDGSPLQQRVATFLRSPSDSLTLWPNTPADYGIVSVFTEYLTEQYGPEILTESLRDAQVGIVSLDEFFKRHNIADRFADVFVNWMVAVSLNDAGYDKRFGYVRDELQVMKVEPMSVLLGESSFTVNADIASWQPFWYKFIFPHGGVSGGVTVDIDGATGQYYPAALIVRYTDGSSRVHRIASLKAPQALYIMPQEGGSARIASVLLAITYGGDPDTMASRSASYDLEITVAVTEQSVLNVSAPAVTLTPERIFDGALIRHGRELYVVRGDYRRSLSASVAALYGLEREEAVPVSDQTANRYSVSNYIRAEGQQKVYALWSDGTKHWLHMPWDTFVSSGRDWNSIFTVSPQELALYRTGADITR